MTEEQKEYIRNSPVDSFMGVKWLKITRGWGLREAKEYYEDYCKKFGPMTYGYIFKNKTLPEETLSEMILEFSMFVDENN